jgi:hypothetical protein
MLLSYRRLCRLIWLRISRIQWLREGVTLPLLSLGAVACLECRNFGRTDFLFFRPRSLVLSFPSFTSVLIQGFQLDWGLIWEAWSFYSSLHHIRSISGSTTDNSNLGLLYIQSCFSVDTEIRLHARRYPLFIKPFRNLINNFNQRPAIISTTSSFRTDMSTIDRNSANSSSNVNTSDRALSMSAKTPVEHL